MSSNIFTHDYIEVVKITFNTNHPFPSIKLGIWVGWKAQHHIIIQEKVYRIPFYLTPIGKQEAW